MKEISISLFTLLVDLSEFVSNSDLGWRREKRGLRRRPPLKRTTSECSTRRKKKKDNESERIPSIFFLSASLSQRPAHANNSAQGHRSSIGLHLLHLDHHPLFTLRHLPLHERRKLRRLHPKPIPVAEKQHLLPLAFGALGRLDPLTPARAPPHGLEESEGAAGRVGAVVAAHDGFDGLGRLVGVVEGDGGDVVVQDVGLDDAVEEVPADEAEFPVDGRGGAAGEVPGGARVVRERGVGVLEEGDGDYRIYEVSWR